MNIESILEKIKLFRELVIDSGMQRDIKDYLNAIQQQQNQNLVFMKELSNKVQHSLQHLENYSLTSELNHILRDTESFMNRDTFGELQNLYSDSEIEAPNYHQQFNQILTTLIKGIERNNKEINAIYAVFSKYVTSRDTHIENEQALISLIFKDTFSTGSLKEFAKVLNRWNLALPAFHSLLKSASPDEISIVEIQNGSIDVIINIDIDIVLDFKFLISIGMEAFLGYLLYKTNRRAPILENLLNDVRLIEMEKEADEIYLSGIQTALRENLSMLHEKSKEEDENIDSTGTEIKINLVCETISDHIVKGNEIKLLKGPSEEESDDEDTSPSLREHTSIVRQEFKKLSDDDKQVLLEKYSIKNDEE